MVTIEDCSLEWQSPREEALSHVDLAGLVSTYSALLFRVAHSVVRSPSEAEDIVQDTFVRVLQHRHQLPAVREMRIWLVRITWNLALDRRRRIRPDQIDDLFARSIANVDTPADQALSHAQQLSTVLSEIERLPKAERNALLLSALDEMSTADLAAILGKSESGVRALLFRARTRLKERLSKAKRKGDPR